MRIAIILLVISYIVSGCFGQKIIFNNPNKTRAQFYEDREYCGGAEGSDGLIFGPAMIVAPIAAVTETGTYFKGRELQKCMEARGWKCVQNCPITDADPVDRNPRSGAQ